MHTSLVNLFDNDCLDDQFFVDVSPDGKHIATGAYNKSGHVMDVNFTENRAINCRFKQNRDTPVGSLKVYSKNKKLISSPTSPIPNKASGKAGSTAVDRGGNDLRKRVQLGAWKPTGPNELPNQHTLALVFRNCIYLYYDGALNNNGSPKKLNFMPRRV